MTVHTTLQHEAVANLWLDPDNPRLGRRNTEKKLSQSEILDLMKDWTLDELAVSFLESGFWPQEAVLVVKELFNGSEHLVVVEGNRRLAALKTLFMAVDGNAPSKRWAEIATEATKQQLDGLLEIPYLLADSRQDVETYLGFRHVTGIKEWNPAEKAQYIAQLIDKGMTYREVMRKIGSKTPTVRQNYIAYRLLLQMEDVEGVAIDRVEEKFSVLYLSLRASGVRSFLSVSLDGDVADLAIPVPVDKLPDLVWFSRWVFGDDEHEPVVTDSRQIDKFARVLEDPGAVEYLKLADAPTLEMAYRRTGGEAEDAIVLIERARFNIEEALTMAHRYASHDKLRRVVLRFSEDANQLFSIFEPAVPEQVSNN